MPPQHGSRLLDRQQRYAQTTELDGRRAAGFHLVLTAATVAATSDVPPVADEAFSS